MKTKAIVLCATVFLQDALTGVQKDFEKAEKDRQQSIKNRIGKFGYEGFIAEQ